MGSTSDAIMDKLLKDLMESLEAIGKIHEELYDSVVRENMYSTIYQSFLKPQEGYVIPDEYGMYEHLANREIKIALTKYIIAANQRAIEMGCINPNDRLAAFQNGEIYTRDERQYYDDFFGWTKFIK